MPACVQTYKKNLVNPERNELNQLETVNIPSVLKYKFSNQSMNLFPDFQEK